MVEDAHFMPQWARCPYCSLNFTVHARHGDDDDYDNGDAQDKDDVDDDNYDDEYDENFDVDIQANQEAFEIDILTKISGIQLRKIFGIRGTTESVDVKIGLRNFNFLMQWSYLTQFDYLPYLSYKTAFFRSSDGN